MNKAYKNPYGFVYITTNIINGKRYIGQRKFYSGWKSYVGSGVKLLNSIKKYGKENFKRDIVYIANDEFELNKVESELILLLNAVESDDYYNMCDGGNVSNTFANKTKEEMNEISRKISEGNKGKCLSNEHKDVLKRLNSGENHPMYGKSPTKETREKISQSRVGKYIGEENPNSKQVKCTTTGEVFESATHASNKYNVGVSNIIKCCRNKAKTCGKCDKTGIRLEWEYFNS